MATAKANTVTKKITKTITVDEEVPDGTITLTLSKYEAEALMTITRLVGGDASSTRRGFTDAVCGALEQAGVPRVTGEDANGSISFGDLPHFDPRRAELPKDGRVRRPW